jgi:uncharacterized membrane protein YdjX (TVP38/TMEM64 family)
MSDAPKAERAGDVRRRKWPWIVGLVVVILLAVGFRVPGRVQALMQATLEQVGHMGYWAPILFVLLYVAACVALVPASILTVGAGALFGVVRGSVYVSVAATLGATAAFLVGRYLARDWVKRKVGRHSAFVAIDQAVAEEGWRIVFLTRLSPIFPFFLMNYAYGLTRVSLRHYVLATWIGIIPGSTLFVYIGSLAGSEAQGTSVTGWVGKGFILVTALLTTVYLARLARRALSRQLSEPGEAPPDGNG